MKLYYSPGACSMACRISLHEAGIVAEFERVDLKSKITERGYDYTAINPKGYVPMLLLDDGATVTEIDAVLDFIVDHEPKLGPAGPLARTRLLEMLAYLSSELHVAFKPLWRDASEADKALAAKAVAARLEFIENHHLDELYLFGARFTVADAYLFVMLRWARAFAVPVSAQLTGYFERVLQRATVRQALTEEGLVEPALVVTQVAETTG